MLNKNDTARRLWLRVHPSIFSEVWDALKLAASQSGPSSSNWKDPLQIRDLRGEIDSLEIIGPKSGKTLRRIMKLCKSESGIKRNVRHHDTIHIEQKADRIAVLRRFASHQ